MFKHYIKLALALAMMNGLSFASQAPLRFQAITVNAQWKKQTVEQTSEIAKMFKEKKHAKAEKAHAKTIARFAKKVKQIEARQAALEREKQMLEDSLHESETMSDVSSTFVTLASLPSDCDDEISVQTASQDPMDELEQFVHRLNADLAAREATAISAVNTSKSIMQMDAIETHNLAQVFAYKQLQAYNTLLLAPQTPEVIKQIRLKEILLQRLSENSF